VNLADLLVEKKAYDKDHVCETPGAVYSTTIHDEGLTIHVKLPKKIDIPEDAGKELEVDLHYAIEKVLRKFWK
jgi:restriction endonuclease